MRGFYEQAIQASKSPRRLRTPAAGECVGLAASTMEKYRVFGGGPMFSKLGRIVVYDISDLDAWVAARKVNSTSEVQN